MFRLSFYELCKQARARVLFVVGALLLSILICQCSFLNRPVSAQGMSNQAIVDKVINDRLAKLNQEIKDIYNKTTDVSEAKKQAEKARRVVEDEGVKFIEDAAAKAFLSEDALKASITRYIKGLQDNGAGRCPYIVNLAKKYPHLKSEFPQCFPKAEGAKTCPHGTRLISDCIKEGINLHLVGDGVNTSKCTLVLENPRTGKTSSTPLHTVCISRKTLKPPAPESIAMKHSFKIVPTPTPISNILRTSKRLASTGQYDDVPLSPEKRNSTIMQLAVWSHIGGNDENSPDAINPKSIKKDLLHKANVDEKDLSPAEQEEVNKRVDKIFEKVNLTEKESQVPEPEQPKKTDEPKQPEQPTEPIEPGQPNKPEEPEEPNQPEEPGTPGLVCIPEYTTFHCSEEGYQDMCTTEEVHVPCPNDSTVLQTDSTIGGRTDMPPTEGKVLEEFTKLKKAEEKHNEVRRTATSPKDLEEAEKALKREEEAAQRSAKAQGEFDFRKRMVKEAQDDIEAGEQKIKDETDDAPTKEEMEERKQKLKKAEAERDEAEKARDKAQKDNQDAGEEAKQKLEKAFGGPKGADSYKGTKAERDSAQEQYDRAKNTK